MPSMAPLSGGNRDGDRKSSRKRNGVSFGGHLGAPESSSEAVDLAGRLNAASAPPETSFSKHCECFLKVEKEPWGSFIMANNARKLFLNVDGDHIIFVNGVRHYIQEAGARAGEGECTSSNSSSNENKKVSKRIRRWCISNFINAWSLRPAVDTQKQIRGYVEGMA